MVQEFERQLPQEDCEESKYEGLPDGPFREVIVRV